MALMSPRIQVGERLKGGGGERKEAVSFFLGNKQVNLYEKHKISWHEDLSSAEGKIANARARAAVEN